MRSVSKGPARLAAALAALMVMIGCGGPIHFAREVQEDQHRYVRLEARSALPFAHPVSLNEADWVRILHAIRVQPRKTFLTLGMEQAGPTEAFDEEERQYLAPLLAKAFAKVRRDEWVVFYLSHPREQRGGPGVREETSGGFFIQGEQLHFLLANYRYAVSMTSIQEQIREDPLRPSGESFYELVPSQNQSVRSVKTWDMTEPVRARASELVLNYQALLSSPDERTPKPERGPSLEERLRTLDRLYKDGLITEEEYRLKRQRLLDEL
jgi:hypothetical protein